MFENTPENLLLELGFTEVEAKIYLILNKFGEIDVSEVVKESGFSRTAVYEALNSLLAQNAVIYRKEGRNVFYSPVHPNYLAGLLEQKKRQTALEFAAAQTLIQELSGVYNLATHKPGVRFFEGIEGFKDALQDSLTATETVYAYVDKEATASFAKDINAEYVKKRADKKIKKYILAADTAEARALLQNQPKSEWTETRFLPTTMKPFHTAMQIYNNKICYFTLREENIVSVLVHDKDIYDMHRNMFEFLWNLQTPQQTSTHPPTTPLP